MPTTAATRRALLSLIAISALSACGGGSGSSLIGGLPRTANALAPATGTTVHTLSVTTSTAPVVAQSATAGTAGTGTSVSASLAAAPAAGSLLVAYIGAGDAATVTTPPAGWTAAVDPAGHACSSMTGGSNAQGEQVYTHTVATGEGVTPYKFTFAASVASPYAIALLEVRNVPTTGAIAACGSANPAKGTAVAGLTSATLTTTAVNQLPLAGYAPSTSGLTFTRVSGWSGTLYNAAQTPWMTLNVESGPVTTAAGSTIAPSTTVSNLSTATIVYAPTVSLLINPLVTTAASTAGPVVAQSATAGTVGTAKTLSASFTAAPLAGSLLVAYIGNGNASTLTTPPSGWTAAVDVNGNACSAMTGGADAQGEQVYLHTVAAAGEGVAPYTFTFASTVASPYAIALLEVRNVQATNPIAACGSVNPAQGTATSSLASARLSATAANQLPLAGYAPSTSGLTFTRSSSWTGSLYNSAQTPWLTLDVESGPLTAATGSAVAPTTTVSNLSGATIVYAPSVAMLISSTTVTGTGNPVATPTPAPAATPTSAPSSGTVTGGVAWPASFRPYSSSAYINIAMSNQTNPTLVPNSDSIVANAIQSTSDGQQLRAQDIDLNDGSAADSDHPWFVAQSTDPLVSVKCTQYCSSGNPAVTSMRIPAKARPGNQADSHITVIQPNGEEYDTWVTSWPSSNWSTGSTLTAATVTDCGNFYTGTGLGVAGGYTSTVSNTCLQGGMINYNEAFASTSGAGSIKHALFLRVGCGNTTPGVFRYPAAQTFDVACPDGQPSFENGDHVWLDLTDAAIDALHFSGTASDQIWQKNVLKALHEYGGYIGDSAGSPCGSGHGCAPEIGFEDSGSYTALGITAPWQTYAAANGWQLQQFGTAKYYQFAAPWNPLTDAGVSGGWTSHLHLVDPCYAHGSC